RRVEPSNLNRVFLPHIEEHGQTERDPTKSTASAGSHRLRNLRARTLHPRNTRAAIAAMITSMPNALIGPRGGLLQTIYWISLIEISMSATRAVDITETIDNSRFGSFQLGLCILCALGLIMDG